MICLLNVVNLVLQINNLNREIATAAKRIQTQNS